MNESHAWLFLASLWDKPQQYRNHSTRVHTYVGATGCTGICFQLHALFRNDEISESVWRSMVEKVRDEAIRLETEGYLWTTDRAGAAERAAFCRRMALEYLRGQLRAGRISYDELHALQSLTTHIAPDDVELLEAAGVPEGGEAHDD